MSNDPDIFIVSGPDAPGVAEAGHMLEEMYRFMEQHGLMVPLAPGGKDKWLKSARQSMGRFSCLVMAKSNDHYTGFAYGAIRFLPDYLGSGKVGVVTHIYVRESERQSGIGKMMLDKLEQWFLEKGVSSVKLQVVSGNREARHFWKQSAYRNELTQYRKFF